MRWFAVIPMALYLLVATAVGVQLLRLARKTRLLPEFALGAGLVSIALLGQPVAAVGRAPALIGSGIGDALLAMGVVISHTGLALLFVFTWSVFRRDSTWAGVLVIVAGLTLATSAAGLIHVGIGSTDMQEIFSRTRPFAVVSVGTIALCFAWNGIESARYARMLRRRLVLGLADPVIIDRFDLWALVGFSSATMCSVLAGCMIAGLPPLTEPIPLVLSAVMSIVAASGWYLSFLPPQRYLAFVRSRGARLRDPHAAA